MKTKIWLNFSLALGLALALIIFFGSLIAQAQGPIGSGFTYQGRLLRGSLYPDGIACDFTFSLFAAPAGGSPLGGIQPVNGVPVRDGYFQVELNGAGQFGPIAFDGNRRYLEVAVRCPGDSSYNAIPTRVELKPVPYAQHVISGTLPNIDWNNVTSKPAGFADNVDNVNTYTAGFGLTLSGTQFSLNTPVVANAISQSVQLRVTGSCVGNESIQVINRDGSVLCASTALTYTSSDGVNLNGNTFSIDDTVVQRRVTGDCGPPGSGRVIRRIYQDGTVLCEDIPPGDITAINAGAGLSGGGTGPGSITLTVANAGINNAMLADNAVTSGRLATGAIQRSDLISGVVNSNKILDRSLLFSDFGMNCAAGQLMKWNNTLAVPAWECAPNTLHNLEAGQGITTTPSSIAATIGEGITFDSSDYMTVFYGGAGSASRPTRSDHNHDLFYVKPDSTVSSGDVSGSYNDGLTVTRLQNRLIKSGTPATVGQALRFVGVNWQAASYDFPLNTEVTIYSKTGANEFGTLLVSCQEPTKELLVGGGCNCDIVDKLQDSFPTGPSTWYCDCQAGASDATVYAICLKPTYP